MSVVVIGLNHRTAPLDLLERMSVGDGQLPKALHDLTTRPNISEALVLSTCNRTEVYAVAERFHGAYSDIRGFLADFLLPAARRVLRPPLRPLRLGRGAAPHGGDRRARLGRAGRERDPGPDQGGLGAGPRRGHPPARRSTCSCATPSRPASGRAPRRASPAASRRSRRPRWPWPTSAWTASPGRACSSSAPVRWARAWRSRWRGRRRRRGGGQPHQSQGPRPRRPGGRTGRPLLDVPDELGRVDVLLTSTGSKAPLIEKDDVVPVMAGRRAPPAGRRHRGAPRRRPRGGRDRRRHAARHGRRAGVRSRRGGRAPPRGRGGRGHPRRRARALPRRHVGPRGGADDRGPARPGRVDAHGRARPLPGATTTSTPASWTWSTR